MFRSGIRVLLKTLVLGAMLLVYPCATFAQRGAGGGHAGGGTASGGGLSSTGKPTGVDVKDDLKDFHEALAVQATSQQIVDFAEMMKSTEAANAELKTFMEHLSIENGASKLVNRSAIVKQSIEKARTENNKFLSGFSERQKSGLKEITRKLTKADSDLAQQVRDLDERSGDTKTAGPLIANSAQSLERALAGFKSEQVALGVEMSIGASNNGPDSAFNLPPVKSSVKFANQSVVITTSGIVSKGTADKDAAEAGQNTFKLELTVDLSDLQQNIAEVLRAQLDKESRCGERVAIRTGTLTPSGPASLVLVQLHYERWACLGREVNEMVEGNGTVEVKLTPSVTENGMLLLTPAIGRIEAEGMIGDLLRSGSLGEALRDKIAESLLSAVRQGGDFNATLPPSARANAAFRSARFQGTGSGRLLAVLDGEIHIPSEQLASFIHELKTDELKTGEIKTDEMKTGESKARELKGSSTPETMQVAVPR
jgi:hypothetical protein